jgi:hypothetical protein
VNPVNEIEWLLEASPECQRDEDHMASLERLIAISIDHLAWAVASRSMTSARA